MKLIRNKYLYMYTHSKIWFLKQYLLAPFSIHSLLPIYISSHTHVPFAHYLVIFLLPVSFYYSVVVTMNDSGPHLFTMHCILSPMSLLLIFCLPYIAFSVTIDITVLFFFHQNLLCDFLILDPSTFCSPVKLFFT